MFRSFRRWFTPRFTTIRRPEVRPQLLRLEDRLTPTTLTVTNTNDSGTGSLRVELGLAAGGDTIVFSTSTAGGAVNFADGTMHTIATGSTLAIGTAVTIDGPPLDSSGAPLLTVSGANAFSLFTVGSTTTAPAVTLSQLEITNGLAAKGGGVDVISGALTLTDSLVTGNTAQAGSGYSYGGGVYLQAGSLTLTRTTVSGNEADFGGGVADRPNSSSSATITIDHSSVGAATVSSTALPGNTAQSGGGVLVGNHTTLAVTDSTVSGNTAYSPTAGPDYYAPYSGPDGISLGAGGGITVGAGGSLTVERSTVSDNDANWDGGGICFVGTTGGTAGGTLTVADSTVSGNATLGVFNSGSGASTIALYSAGGGLAISRSSGHVGTLSNSTIYGNYAPWGGGISLEHFSSELDVQNCTITANVAGDGGGGVLPLVVPHGGGGGIDFVYTDPTTSPPVSGTLVLESTIVADNTAVTGSDVDLAAAQGGGVGHQAIITANYCLIGVNTVTLSSSANNIAGNGSAPQYAYLDPLADNGGPTQTCSLQLGSPAVDAGHNYSPTTLTTDQRGPSFVRTNPDATSLPTGYDGTDIGAFEEQLKVVDVQVNNGDAQRSEVRSVTITFNEPYAVTFAGTGTQNANAALDIQLIRLDDANGNSFTHAINLSAIVGTNFVGQTTVTLTFLTTTTGTVNDTDPDSTQNGGQLSLNDGLYQMTVPSTDVTSAFGGQLTGDGVGTGASANDFVSPLDYMDAGGQVHTFFGLYRLFGDATGDGVNDLSDLSVWRGANGTSVGNPAYLAYLDWNNDGTIDSTDLAEFLMRLNYTVY